MGKCGIPIWTLSTTTPLLLSISQRYGDTHTNTHARTRTHSGMGKYWIPFAPIAAVANDTHLTRSNTMDTHTHTRCGFSVFSAAFWGLIVLFVRF